MNLGQTFLEFAHLFPSPFSMGEGEGGGGLNKNLLVPPPYSPLPPRGGEISGGTIIRDYLEFGIWLLEFDLLPSDYYGI